jgi:hypothetical protein
VTGNENPIRFINPSKYSPRKQLGKTSATTTDSGSRLGLRGGRRPRLSHNLKSGSVTANEHQLKRKHYMKSKEKAGMIGATGWILLWLLGIPIPILLLLFLLRGCT